MTAQLCLVVLFYTLSPSLAGFSQLEHPQQAFCEADFVIRAAVMSGPENHGSYEVFNISIREVFKGLPHGSQEEAFGVFGTELSTKLYAPSRYVSSSISGPFGIKSGTEYYLYGTIIKGGKLYTTFSYRRGAWSKVTPRQKANLRGYYEAGCRQCLFKPNECSFSSDPKCQKRLSGCEQKAREMSLSWMKSICWREFEHCEVDESGQRCQWKETEESRACKKKSFKMDEVTD